MAHESDDLRDFTALVRAAARPIDDHRSTADYRRHAVGVCAERALRRAFASDAVEGEPWKS
jgi:CO/xanthine dehydrogenase FAD-binding subunit